MERLSRCKEIVCPFEQERVSEDAEASFPLAAGLPKPVARVPEEGIEGLSRHCE